MKFTTKYIFFFLIFLFPILAVSQWEEVKAIPQQYINNYWLEIFFLPSNNNYAWVCGFNGMVMRSTDRGLTWSGVKIPNAGQLESIIFVTEKIGYVVSVAASGSDSRYSRLFKTDDGGISWRDVSPRTDISFWGTYFLNENLGVLVGGFCSNRYFFKTTDGGRTWTFQSHFDTFTINDSKLSDVILYDDGRGYAVSSGTLWETNDFGSNWKLKTKIKANNWHEELSIYRNSILVPYDYSCAGSQAKGGAVFSSDFGKSWHQSDFPKAFYGSFLVNDSVGWICGLDRSIYQTRDYGKTWISKPCGISPSAHLDDLFFIDDTTGWVVGNGIYKYKIISDTINPKITADKYQLCSDDYAIIKANINYPNIIWNNGETTPQIVVNKPGIYYLKSSTNECDSGTSNSIEITFVNKSDLEFNNNAIYEACDGDSVFVQLLSNVDKITWYDGNDNKSRFFSESGWKSFSWVDTTGCVYYDSINVNILPLPIADLDSSFNAVLCEGRKQTIHSKSSPQAVDWYDADNNQLIASNSTFIELDKSKNIFVIAKNILDCADTSEIYTYNIDFENDYFELVGFNHLDTIFFDSLYTNDITCKELYIKNVGTKPISLSKIYLKSNSEFSIPQSQLPLHFNPNEIKSIQICYSPIDYKQQSDILIFTDLCSETNLILSGFAKKWSYSTGTKCGLSITITSRDFGKKTIFSTNPPFPNPTNSKINIEYTFSSFDKKGKRTSINNFDSNKPVKFELYDILGKRINLSNSQINKLIYSNNGLEEKGNYQISLGELNKGLYNLNISIDEEIINYILIIK